ncbi:AAA family ATPase [Actinoplanes sp. LDG1-06]|uniref:AAA family ATPase n=1 Tax=Paractinoplanes ovalisporus TaxID=2810368 RepID=A0ABS2A9T0_9ACTN|nr:LuxR family transcriptional regulator [Actinoplanes ovalisporus]MBM2616011.1 AAA family ATPase [Actinoplanes ovalisporus]
MLFGRDEELRQIAAVLESPRGGRLLVLALEGPRGSGRTRLLDETARLARQRGITVFAEPEWAGAVGSRQVLRTVGDRPGSLLFLGDHPRRIDPRAWAVLDLLAETTPTLVALTGPAEGAVHLPAADVHRIRVTPLAPAAQAEFVAQLAGARPGPQLVDLCRVASGRPGCLRELVRGLDEEGLLHIAGGWAVVRAVRLPRRSEAALRGQVASVSPPARHLLQAAATLGESFPLMRLARLMGVGPVTMLPALEEALASGLLGGDGELLAFGHELVRAAVEATLPRPVAAALRVRPDWELLSPREREVAELVRQALTNRQIATRTGISAHTVNYHLRQIFQKLGIGSRVELVALWPTD